MNRILVTGGADFPCSPPRERLLGDGQTGDPANMSSPGGRALRKLAP